MDASRLQGDFVPPGRLEAGAPSTIEAMGVPELKLRKRLLREQSWSW